MKTLQQLDDLLLGQIREDSSDSHFTTSQRYGYLNQATEHIALLTNPPSDSVSVAVESNKGAYTLPSDNVFINSAFFGDVNTANDVRKLTIISKTNAGSMFPQWMDETSATSGQPTHLWYLDDTTAYIHPKPSSAYAGKRLILNYGFTPATMSNTTDVPDIKSNYHNLIPILAGAFAFYSLHTEDSTNAGDKLYALFKSLLSDIKLAVEKESEETFAFKWGVKE